MPDQLSRRRFTAVLSGFTLFGFPAFGWLPKENAENIQIWTTRDWRRVRVCDMSDDHLRNTIFYLNKHYGYITGSALAFHNTEQANERFLKGTPGDMLEIYDVMRREAQRRRLSWI